MQHVSCICICIYGAVRTIVLSRHESNLARPVIIHDINHGLYMCQVLHIVDFLGSRRMGTAPTSIEVLLRPTRSQSDEPSDLRGSLSLTSVYIRHLAVPGGHPSNYEPGATLLNFSDRAETDERTPYSVCYMYIQVSYLCESLHFVQYAWSSYFALILSCLTITKLLKFKMAARPPF